MRRAFFLGLPLPVREWRPALALALTPTRTPSPNPNPKPSPNPDPYPSPNPSPTPTRCEWATLLSGTDEGVYGWVTVNYLLDALYPSTAPVPPVGIIDLGGGSVQVVFASSTGKDLKHMDFGGRGHDTYIKSHLGCGRLDDQPQPQP